MEFLYVNTKDLIKIRTISIRAVSLYFVSFRYKSILKEGPRTSYISFIISKASHNSNHFHFGWLLSRNLGILDIQTVKRGIYRRKSANVRLTCILKYVPGVILDRKSFLLWKDINACRHTHTHKHTQRNIHRHVHTYAHKRSITIKAVGIKYKDASNLQTPLFEMSNFVSATK